ncbi:MAG: cellulase family glycosylhydrolase, partial [bacterium]
KPKPVVTQALTVTKSHPVGLNKYDLVRQYLGRNATGPISEPLHQTTLAMAKRAIRDAAIVKAPFFRFAASMTRPRKPGADEDLELWLHNQEAHWRRIDALMDDLDGVGIRAVPVFLWNYQQFPSITHETTRDLITRTESKSYRMFMSYVGQFINRYKDRKTILFYDLTNELNLYVDRDIEASCKAEPSRDKEECALVRNMTSGEMEAFMARFAADVRKLDPNHKLSSGFSMPLRNAAHLRRDRADVRDDTMADLEEVLTATHKDCDIVSVHYYDHAEQNIRFDAKDKFDPSLLRKVKAIADKLHKPLFVGEFGDIAPSVKEDKTAKFTHKILDLGAELDIPYMAVWGWELYPTNTFTTYDNPNTQHNIEPGYTDDLIERLKAANGVGGGFGPMPQVVIAWPLPDSSPGKDEFVHVVASSGLATGVEVKVFVDDQLIGSSMRPPFRVPLPQLLPGKHKVMAEVNGPGGATQRVNQSFVIPP